MKILELENRCTGNRTVGSNPTLSASLKQKIKATRQEGELGEKGAAQLPPLLITLALLAVFLTAVQLRGVARARPLQPRVVAIDLAKIDLLERIVPDLGPGDFLPIAASHSRDILFFAIGRGDRAVFRHLKIAPALDARGGR